MGAPVIYEGIYQQPTYIRLDLHIIPIFSMLPDERYRYSPARSPCGASSVATSLNRVTKRQIFPKSLLGVDKGEAREPVRR